MKMSENQCLLKNIGMQHFFILLWPRRSLNLDQPSHSFHPIKVSRGTCVKHFQVRTFSEKTFSGKIFLVKLGVSRNLCKPFQVRVFFHTKFQANHFDKRNRINLLSKIAPMRFFVRIGKNYDLIIPAICCLDFLGYITSPVQVQNM